VQHGSYCGIEQVDANRSHSEGKQKRKKKKKGKKHPKKSESGVACNRAEEKPIPASERGTQMKQVSPIGMLS
jgi:hypothetical protein